MRTRAGAGARADTCSGSSSSSSRPESTEPADEARDQQRCDHRGEDQEQQIISGEERAEGRQRDGQNEQRSGARDPVAHSPVNQAA